MSGLAWPSCRDTKTTFAPCAIKSEAYVCRRSCQRSLGRETHSSAMRLDDGRKLIEIIPALENLRLELLSGIPGRN
jgi:hypothetical protein